MQEHGSDPTHERHLMVQTDDDASLAVWVSGPATGEPIVLIHGFSLDHSAWKPVASSLAGYGYHVILVDLRGHGRSTLGTAAPTVERFIADVNAIMNELGLVGVHLVGHSLGAVVALAARTDNTISSSIASITSISGTEESIQNPIMRLGAYLFGSPLGVWLLGRRRPGRLLISTWFGQKPAAEDLDSIRLLVASCARETRESVTKATGDIDLRPSLGQAGPPTLVMCGRKDQATPFKVSERIAAAIEGATLLPIDGAGHMVIIERSDVVSSELDSWIKRSTAMTS